MKTLMVQGTTSDAGKSTLVAGLCRVFADLGYRVAPFKPQNMALNSAVTEDGGEIGRAQALQAVAARVPARVDFNPILLKPNSDTGAQVIIHGRAISNMEAQSYHDYKKVAMSAVLKSHQRLVNDFDLIMVEGAGSPAEINLRENDIANMGYAEAVDCPVIIIADIDKGGVFAHLVGTLALLSESEQARVKGFVINRFRGDIALLQSGLDWLEEKTGKPVLGVLPYLHELALDAEDAIAVENVLAKQADQVKFHIAVLLLPHISNHTDFDSLRLNPQVNLSYVHVGQSIPACDLIIVPGSKNVIADLSFLTSQGWQQQIQQHSRYGGKVLGICGGYQMLGQTISDPNGIESSTKSISGLNLLAVNTELTDNKTLTKVSGTLTINQQSCPITGYEIHCGVTQNTGDLTAIIHFEHHPNGELIDGVISADGQIIGTYLHGLFDSVAATELLLNWLKPDCKLDSYVDLDSHRELQLNKLADVCRDYLAIDKINKIIKNEH
jgi:adenosylcobyric acid synthase